MIKSMQVISGDVKKIWPAAWQNAFHTMLIGIPYGCVFVVMLELFKPPSEMNMERVVWMLVVMGVIVLANVFLAMKVHTSAFITSYTLSSTARLRLADHLRKLSMGFFKQRDPGDITSLLLQDMAKVELVFSHLFIDALASAVIPSVMLVIFVMVDVRLSALVVGAVSLAIPVLMVGQKVIAWMGRKHLATRNEVTSRVLEYLQGIRVLKAFNLTGPRSLKLQNVLRRYRDDSIKLEVAAGGPVLSFMTILELGFIGLLVAGVYFRTQGSLATETLLIFLVIGYKFFEPLCRFGGFVSEMRYMNLAAARITDVMETPELPVTDNPKYPENHHVSFDGVRFSYTDKDVIKGVSARFEEGSVTALVGPSGSGKSTMTRLLARFWDVNGGSVSIGGVDVRDMDIEELYSRISMVFQDVYLFSDTVLNNIKVGRRDASHDEIVAAAKAAQCHDFIMGLEKGYDTLVGEGGSTLSGGEKQRISIARALLKDAPIVLLDEATASLDPENERLIQQAISQLVSRKTLIVIAHRLSTIRDADQILVMDQGQVAECGNHDELMAVNGLYTSLWNEQQRIKGWKFGSYRRET